MKTKKRHQKAKRRKEKIKKVKDAIAQVDSVYNSLIDELKML